MQAPLLYNIHQQNLWLSVHRSIFWEEQKTLIISDLHFGKTGHFRKSGIAVPQDAYKEDLQRFVNLLHHFQPKTLLVVGDFFHSHANNELEWFLRWREEFSNLTITLVKGNHDILNKKWYQTASIDVIPEELHMQPFYFVHEHCQSHAEAYTFCGHIHPGVQIGGLAKQSLRFPCFYFSEQHAVLPAFSKFTGMTNMKTEEANAVYAIVKDDLIKIK